MLGFALMVYPILFTILVATQARAECVFDGQPHCWRTEMPPPLSADELLHLPVQPKLLAGCGSNLLPCPIEDIPGSPVIVAGPIPLEGPPAFEIGPVIIEPIPKTLADRTKPLRSVAAGYMARGD